MNASLMSPHGSADKHDDKNNHRRQEHHMNYINNIMTVKAKQKKAQCTNHGFTEYR